jgi:hypothetical protein
MANRKKGQINQVLAPLVDATDFASIESAIVASNIVRRFFGVNHGTSAASTSGAISKVPSTVRSGLFRITLKGTECAYDEMMVRLSATGAALQLIPLEFGDVDDSDLASQLTILQSMVSDAHSAAAQANSRVLVAQSFLSDIRSHVSDLQSDFQSRVPKAVATNSQLSDLHSDLRSFLVVMSGVQSDVLSALLLTQSMASDAASAAQQASSRILVNTSLCSDVFSQLSDFRSDLTSFLTTTGVQLNASMLSDLRSAITAGPAGVLTVSDISDIASRVDTVLASRLSDILSAATQINSRVLVVQSMASDAASAAQQGSSRVLVNTSLCSDIFSQLSDFRSDLNSLLTTTGVQVNASSLSDIRSAIAGITATVSASDMSDIASRVGVLLASDLSDILSAAQQANSRVLIVQSQTSDLASKVSDVESNLLSFLATTGVQLNTSAMSDLRSAVNAVTVNLTASDISDIASAVAAAVTTITASDISDIASAVRAAVFSDLSDILSAAQQANSRVLLNQSRISDVYSLLSDFNSNFNSRVPLEPAGRSQLSDLVSDVKSAVTVVQSMASDAASAAQQANSRVLVVQSHASDIYSLLSDVQSDFQSRVPKRVATDSQLSALASDVISALAAGVPVSASDMSDLRSAIAANQLTASTISDIASAVALEMASNLSDILSGVRSNSSRLLVAQSQTSDIYSLLSDLHSDVGVLSGVVSDIDSALDTGVEIGPSSLSDLRSVVAAHGVLRTGAEPAGVPAHTATFADKVDWVAGLSRNRLEQTATVQRVKNQANNDTIASAAVSDDGTTFVRDGFV